MNQVIQNVSDPAFLVAGFRALESERPEPLFRDPLAWKLAGDHGRKILATVPKTFVGGWSVVIRTVIIDNFIKEAIEQGVDTILNLGAGLDTRPYRMELPETLRWIEVDFPHVIAHKGRGLPTSNPIAGSIASNSISPTAPRGSGFSPRSAKVPRKSWCLPKASCLT